MMQELTEAEAKVDRTINYIFIGTCLLGFLIVTMAIYGMCAHFLIIPEYKHKIKIYDMRIQTKDALIELQKNDLKDLQSIWVSHSADTVNIQMKVNGEPKTVYYHRLAPLTYSHSEWISLGGK